LWIEQIRAASFRVLYDVYDGETLAAQASTTLVTYDFSSDRPRRITPEERRILSVYADEPVAEPT
jgi:acyl-CoA thioester hydrolase